MYDIAANDSVSQSDLLSPSAAKVYQLHVEDKARKQARKERYALRKPELFKAQQEFKDMCLKRPQVYARNRASIISQILDFDESKVKFNIVLRTDKYLN